MKKGAGEKSKKIHDYNLSNYEKLKALLQLKSQEGEWYEIKYERAVVHYFF